MSFSMRTHIECAIAQPGGCGRTGNEIGMGMWEMEMVVRLAELRAKFVLATRAITCACRHYWEYCGVGIFP